MPWLEYGIETRITAIIGLVPFTILAIKLSDIPTTLAFLATFNFLRKRVGGYHANSVLGCMLLSLFLEVLFLGAFLPKLNMVVFFISNGVSLAIIYFMAPYVHPNMNFSKNYTINITATSVVDGYYGYFYINNVSYRINAGLNTYDSITNFGTAKKGANCVRSEMTDDTANESAYGYARLAYDLGFKIGPLSGQIISTELVMHVGEDTAVIDHSVRE